MSKITPLKTTNTFSSTSTASSNSTPACSPTTSTSSNDSNALKFFDKTLDKVKAYVPHNHHHHHHQSKKTYSQPPTSIPQQHHRSRSTESLRSVQRRQTVAQYGRHSNEWLFGGVSVRRAVSGLFQQEN